MSYTQDETIVARNVEEEMKEICTDVSISEKIQQYFNENKNAFPKQVLKKFGNTNQDILKTFSTFSPSGFLYFLSKNDFIIDARKAALLKIY